MSDRARGGFAAEPVHRICTKGLTALIKLQRGWIPSISEARDGNAIGCVAAAAQRNVAFEARQECDMAKYGILVAIDGLVSSPRCKATQNGHVGSGGIPL